MNDNIGPMAVMAVIIILIIGILFGMFGTFTGPNISAQPHAFAYSANVNFTESGLPAGTNWGGSVVIQGGTYGSFTTTKTYDNFSVSSTTVNFNGSFTMNDVLIGGNHYYLPQPLSKAFAFVDTEPITHIPVTVNESINYIEVTGYLCNVTTYSLPFDTVMSGYFYNNLYPANQTYYFSTTANTVNTVLPNGTWFVHLNDSYYANPTNSIKEHYTPLVNDFSFIMDGVNYTIVAGYLDVTPGQIFIVHFKAQGLQNNTHWDFTINGTTFYENSTTNIIGTTLAPGYYNLSAAAIGYTYNGPDRVYIGIDGMTIYLNFTNNSRTGTVNQIAGIFAGAGVSLTGFYSSVSILVGLGAAIGTYYKFEDLVVSGALFVVIPWIVYGIGVASGQNFIQIWVPLWMLFIAGAGFTFTAVMRGGHIFGGTE
jgi:hypothetical protein